MRFTSKIVIAQPRERVLELLMDSSQLANWQPGIKSVTLLSGKASVPGARSRVVFEQRGIRLEMVETVVTRKPPDEFSSTFEARGVRNLVVNRFYKEGSDGTRWVMENTFEFKGLMALVGAFIHDTLAKETLESMRRFKTFAETVEPVTSHSAAGEAPC